MIALFWKRGLLGACSALLLPLTGCGPHPLASAEPTLPIDTNLSTQTSLICPFSGFELLLQMEPDSEPNALSTEVVQEVKQVISNRLNGLDISNAAVVSLPQNQLLIQLPQNVDLEQVERVLSTTAQLEFRPQQPGTEAAFQQEFPIWQQFQSEQLRNDGDDGVIAVNEQLIEQSQSTINLLFGSPVLTSSNIQDAYVQPPDQMEPDGQMVILELDSQGAIAFAEMTKKLAGTKRSVGIFLDGQLLSAPMVDVAYADTGITGGVAAISGYLNAEQANELAIQLRSGSLPVSVQVVEAAATSRTASCDRTVTQP